MPVPSPRTAATALSTLVRAGLLRPPRPDQALGMATALAFWGVSPAGGYAMHAARRPRATALVDPEGSLTFREVDRLTTALAAALRADGVEAGQPVGVLCRNDRRFVLSVVALSKIGATAVLLNTGSAAPQLAEVAESERLVAVLCDPSFVDRAPPGLPAYGDLLALAAEHADAKPRQPGEQGKYVILTSGTTGAPKGARRSPPSSLEPVVALLSAMPLRAGEPTVVAAPLFHAWGFLNWTLAITIGSTVVLTGSFEAEATLRAVEDNRATALVAVPVMLRRLLAVDAAYDTSSLRVVPVSGSALPPDVATRFLDRFGDVLYDLYGSTEVAWAAIAGPDDMRDAPGSVGRPPYGTTVALLDEDGAPVPPGEVGRIFVGNGMTFNGYTSGGGKEVRDGLVSTGDLGRFDAEGRLYVVGREDDMVVSGGENVFPRPVEDVLSKLPGVADVAVVGVPDEEFGQRLKAVVVTEPGAALTADDVRDAVRRELARHYVPRDVEFTDALPRTETGKVLKRSL
ncbi:MAG TPA: AMP-binding protein [Frankiaceae bacterium]|nr:AMP-binding protein [Frankiaceae bacterium]